MYLVSQLKIFTFILVLLLLFSITVAEGREPNQTKKNFPDIKTHHESKSVKILRIKQTRMLHVWTIVLVQVCAGDEKLYSPELEIRSDRGTFRTVMSGLIMPNSCKSGNFFIMADDPESINVQFVDKISQEISK